MRSENFIWLVPLKCSPLYSISTSFEIFLWRVRESQEPRIVAEGQLERIFSDLESKGIKINEF